MHKIILLSGLCLLTACSGDNLDTPIKTCKSVASVLLAAQIPATAQETQQQTSEAQVVVLNFRLSDEQKDVTVNCIYEPAAMGEDSNVDLFGEFERVPSKMTINGQVVPRRALFDAVNQATLNAGKQVAKDVNQKGLDMINNAKETGKGMANNVNDFIQKQ
ncbi:MAG TPA: hypothetical protein EYG68_05410 [Leucothrix mucor]|nr:hypothetical protein [Leucothrix mucor]